MPRGDMANPIIQAENLGKRYRIGQRERYLTLGDVIGNGLRSRGGRLFGSPALHNRAELWILLRRFSILQEEHWIKNARNQGVQCSPELGLNFQPRNDRSNPHKCACALGCFVLRKIPKSVIPSDAEKVAASQC